jgi:hypothetical protein
MLLIITNKSDFTSDFLVLRLKERAIPFLRLNTEDYLKKLKINFDISSENEEIEIIYENTDINLNDITGIYFRRPILPDLDENINDEDLKFAEREIETTLSGAWKLIDDKLWLNNPKYLYLSNNKIEQLKIAKNLGFLIPDTIITTDIKKIRNFFKKHKSIVGKAVKHGFYSSKNKVKIALTQELDNSFIDNLTSYAKIPMIYQEKLEKKFDIRITVVGNDVFPVALYSQEHKVSKIDWRAWDLLENFDLEHKKIKLPKDIHNKCIQITKHFNLNFSAIDMVLTKDNKYVFLELNPNGQWAWIEKKVGYPIRDSIINFFKCDI